MIQAELVVLADGRSIPLRLSETWIGRHPRGEGSLSGKLEWREEDGALYVIIPSRTFSSTHCKIVEHDSSYVLLDLKSREGTTRNGERLTGPVVLADGDQLCGLFEFRRRAPPRLLYYTGDPPRDYPLSTATTVVGRMPEACGRIEGVTYLQVELPHYSRIQFELFSPDTLPDAWYLQDDKSAGGTFVNGVKCERVQLHDGDRINREFIFVWPDEST